MTHFPGQLPDQGELTAEADVDQRRLTAEEDARLRALTALGAFGALSPRADEVRAALRQRDRREFVREPEGYAVEPVATAAAKFLGARVEATTGAAEADLPAQAAAVQS